MRLYQLSTTRPFSTRDMPSAQALSAYLSDVSKSRATTDSMSCAPAAQHPLVAHAHGELLLVEMFEKRYAVLS